MLIVSIKHTLQDAKRQVQDAAKRQIPFATAVALTKGAQAGKDALQREMQQVFDRPTRYTLNSLYIQPATKRKLEARIWLKSDTFKGTPAERYLLPQIEGGPRRLKRFERALQARGLLPAGMYAVPGAGARLNAYGNISSGQITQILSALHASADPMQNRRKGKTTPYFVGRPGKAPLGVWKRNASGVTPVLIFVRKPEYRKLFHFFEVGERAATLAFEREFPAALQRAISTAK